MGAFTKFGMSFNPVFHGTSHGICGVDLKPPIYNVVSLVFDLPLYIASPFGLVSFPAGVLIGSPALSSD